MKSLTPEETLRAIADGVKLEHKWTGSEWSRPPEWRDFNPLENGAVIENIFNGKHIFRLRQETVTIGNISFPKPESEKPKLHTEYFFPCFTTPSLANFYKWAGDDVDYELLKAGLVHLTKENAIAHAEALIKLSGGKVDD